MPCDFPPQISQQQYEDTTKHVEHVLSFSALSDALPATRPPALQTEDFIPEGDIAAASSPLPVGSGNSARPSPSFHHSETASSSASAPAWQARHHNQPISEHLFFPPTKKGFEARLRWDTILLAVKQVEEEGALLRQSLSALLALLPGNNGKQMLTPKDSQR